MSKKLNVTLTVIFAILTLLSIFYLCVSLAAFPNNFEDEFLISPSRNDDVWIKYNSMYTSLKILVSTSIIITALFSAFSLLKLKNIVLVNRLSLVVSILTALLCAPLFVLFFYGKSIFNIHITTAALSFLLFLCMQSFTIFKNIENLINKPN